MAAPNIFAYIALLGWPLVTIYLVYALRRDKAIIWSVLLAYLFLPSGFGVDLPGLPPMTKRTLPGLSLLLILFFVAAKDMRVIPRSNLVRLFLLMIVLGPFATVLANPDQIENGAFLQPGLTMSDGITGIARSFFVVIPFMIGYSFLRDEESQRTFLGALITCCLIYSVFILIEVRMSPQFHIWVYNYFPHSFAQQVRGGGFRPVVFTSHGLEVAFFVASATAAAAIMWRVAAEQMAGLYKMATAYFFILLVLCKTLASFIYGNIMLALVLWTKPRLQLAICMPIVLFALCYPALRTLDLVPTETLVSMATNVSENRAQSLEFRFDNEDQLLARANERPLLGWGGWGRSRIYSEWGTDLAITDGRWVILFGTGGWISFIAFFGLLAVPILAVYRLSRGPNGAMVTPIISGITLMVTLKMVDLLPNAQLPGWIMLMAGALLGFAENARQKSAVEETRAPPPVSQKPRTIL